MTIKIDIATCGRFHYHKYLRYLAQQSILHRFYCSYKLGFDFGLSKTYIKNYFLKEYLMYFDKRILSGWQEEKIIIGLHRLWEQQVLTNSVKADLLHVMIHGNSLNVIKKYQSQGKFVIGEAVNTHPQQQQQILNQEFQTFGLTYQYPAKIVARMQQEFEAVDLILSASSFVTRSFLAMGFPESKLVTIPYGIEIPKTLSQAKPKKVNKRFRVLCVATITFRKGQRYLIEAIKNLKQQNIEIELVLVGNKDKQYMQVLKSKQLDQYFDHIAHVDNDKILDFMSQFDLFVLPTLEEGFSVVITEALAINVPVVTTKNSGAEDVIINGENGYLVSAFSVAELEQAILQAMQQSWGKFELKFPNWQDYAKQLQTLYQSCL